MSAVLDAGLSHRPAALKYLRTGRVVVCYAHSPRPGTVPTEATVRVTAALEGQPERVVLMDGATWTCTCGAPSTAAAPGCAHVFAACLVLGRGGTQ